jgi:hypothetical protein
MADPTLTQMLVDNLTNILLAVITATSSAVIVAIRSMHKSVDKTDQNVTDVHKLVNGNLSARLAHLQNNLQEYFDERILVIEQRLKGIESRLSDVEEDHNNEKQ